jgi:hypothetical protein
MMYEYIHFDDLENVRISFEACKSHIIPFLTHFEVYLTNCFSPYLQSTQNCFLKQYNFVRIHYSATSFPGLHGCLAHPSGKYVTLATKPRCRVYDISEDLTSTTATINELLTNQMRTKPARGSDSGSGGQI